MERFGYEAAGCIPSRNLLYWILYFLPLALTVTSHSVAPLCLSTPSDMSCFFYFFEVLLKPLREIWGQSCLPVTCWLASEFNCGNAERFTRWTTQLECFGCEAAFAVPLFTCSHYLIRSSPRPFECNVSLCLSHSPLYTYLSVPSCKFFSNFLSISHLAKLQENLASF